LFARKEVLSECRPC